MLRLANLEINNFDLALFSCYALVLIFVSIRAFIPLAELLIYTAVHATSLRNFDCYMITAVVAFFIATSNIKLSSEFRQAFTCFGGIYLLSAINNFLSYHFDYDTGLDQLLKVAVILVNAYILAHLYSDWRRGNAHGLANYCAGYLRRCKIGALHLFKHSENKK